MCIAVEVQIIRVTLTKEVADHDMRSIDSENDGGIGGVVVHLSGLVM